MTTADSVAKLRNFCNILKVNGATYHQYVDFAPNAVNTRQAAKRSREMNGQNHAR